MTEPRLPSARQLVETATAVLEAAGVPSPRHDALALAAHAFGVPRLELVMPPPVTPEVVATMAEVVKRRRRREPLQQIVGHTVFRYVTLRMAPGVFVPRPETEVVAGAAIEEVQRLAAEGHRAPLVIDLCTGSGAIAAAVANETRARVVAVDASEEAAELARTNVTAAAGRAEIGDRRPDRCVRSPISPRNTDLDGAGEDGPWIEVGDVRDDQLLADLAGAADVVVSNPPYIPPDAVPIDPEVRDHDPDLALYGGGADGLSLPAAVVHAASRLLRPGGLLVMEHADVQGAGARALATDGFTEIETGQDLTGRDRYLRARRIAHPLG